MLPSAPIEEVLTTRPPSPFSIIWTAAAWAHRKAPLRLTASTGSHISSPMSWAWPSLTFTTSPSRLMPALLIRMSNRPNSPTAASAILWTSTRSVTSPTTAAARPPASRTSPAACSNGPASRSPSTTQAPSWPKRSAVARPMPLPAPVIQATFPSSFMSSSSPAACRPRRPLAAPLRASPHHEGPAPFLDRLTVLIEHLGVEEDYPAIRLGGLLLLSHLEFKMDGVAELDHPLVADGLLHQCQGGALEDPGPIGHAGRHGGHQHAVSDALPKGGLPGKRGIGVQRVEISRQPGKGHHVGLGHGTALRDECVPHVELLEGQSAAHALRLPRLNPPSIALRPTLLIAACLRCMAQFSSAGARSSAAPHIPQCLKPAGRSVEPQEEQVSM